MERIFPRNAVPIRSTRLALSDITKIYERLAKSVGEQAEVEISKLVKPPAQSEEDFARYKADARGNAFNVTVTVFGREGSSLFGDDVKVFQSPLLPRKIDRIYATNITAYRAFANVSPINFFELMLDFSKPPLIDTQNFVSSPTPNVSNLTVQGDRDGWVASVTESVLGVTREGKTRRGWLHRGFVYDLGLYSIGVPAAIYACWSLADFINAKLEGVHSFVVGTAYIYVVLAVLVGYRALFGYSKWVFPTMELTSNEDSAVRHRAFLFTIVTGLVGKFIYDVL